MTDQIKQLRDRIKSDKEQIRILKEQKAHLTDSLEIKKLAKAIEDLYVDIKKCKNEIALETCIDREFGSISLDD